MIPAEENRDQFYTQDGHYKIKRFYYREEPEITEVKKKIPFQDKQEKRKNHWDRK